MNEWLLLLVRRARDAKLEVESWKTQLGQRHDTARHCLFLHSSHLDLSFSHVGVLAKAPFYGYLISYETPLKHLPRTGLKIFDECDMGIDGYSVVHHFRGIDLGRGIRRSAPFCTVATHQISLRHRRSLLSYHSQNPRPFLRCTAISCSDRH